MQGVGFRYTARAIAARYPVLGFVKNLSDGRVLLIAEGTADALDQLTRAIEAEMDRYLDNTTVKVLPATNEFTRFEIRH